MNEQKLTPEQTKWKSMLAKVEDPELLDFICSTAESNPNYMPNDAEEVNEEATPNKKEIPMGKEPIKPKFPTESDNMDENV